jgi:hypothetical protein
MGRAERRHRLQNISARPTRTCGNPHLSGKEKVEKRATRIKEIEFDGDNGPTADPVVISRTDAPPAGGRVASPRIPS